MLSRSAGAHRSPPRLHRPDHGVWTKCVWTKCEPVPTKLALPEELGSEQIVSSLFEQTLLLLGDAMALMIVDRRQLDLHDPWRHHANLE